MSSDVFTVDLADGSTKEYKIIALVEDEETYIYCVETSVINNQPANGVITLDVFSLIKDNEDYIISPVKNRVRAMELEKDILKTELTKISRNN